MKPPETHFYPSSHSKPHNFHPVPFLFVVIVFLLQFPKTISSIASQIPLEHIQHCNDVVPASTAEPSAFSSSPSLSHNLDFKIGYYSGGDSIFSQPNPATDVLKSATFHARFSQDYLDSNKSRIYKVNGKLVLQIPKSLVISSSGGGVLNPHRGLRRTFRIRGPKIPSVVDREMQRFSLGGFWSESTGRLCMIGSGMSNGNAGKFRTFNVVLKLNYSTSSNISGSLISGVLQSLDSEHSLSYFEPVSLLGVRSFGNYQFSLLDNGKGRSCLSEGENLDVSKANGGLCSVIVHRRIRENADLLDFRNSSSISAFFPFDPNTTLIAEGAWDEKKNGVCGVSCRVSNFRDSLNGASVGDCSIKFSLRYPEVFSLRNRDSIVGEIWSDKSKDDPSYFDMIRLRSVWEVSPGLKNVPGLRYEYTEVDSARRIYASKNVAEHKGKTYPIGDSIDMRFEMMLIDSKGEAAWGVANPLFVGDQPYKYQPYGLLSMSTVSAAHLSNNDSRLLNISYEISYSYRSSDGRILDRGFVISSEGVYDRHSGVLCMVGCSQLQVRYENHSSIKNNSMDCDILVTAQFSPLNSAEKYRVKGTIKSTRFKLDPLYFGPISLSSKSFYAGQAKESIWRMDLEITMVLISNTLACLFVGLQLFHVKKHPEVLPFISVLMLIALTLGHMIPLLLNFEALFVPNHNQQQNAFLQSGGWLEVNEIIVRAVTMVAFLLQFRLLQLMWSERQSDESLKSLWEADRKVLYISLPLYLTGGLIAWFAHLWKNTHQTPFLQPHQRRLPFKNHFYHQTSFWSDLKSYGGLVVDGFLLPQIVFNMFSNSNKTALAASFYLGTTLVRLLPHGYDLYRAHSFSGYLDLSYIYANHKMDLYSTAWDIIIPSGGLLFSIFICLQQRFGGQCLLPKRFRTDAVYEKVSVDNSEELQGESVQRNFYSL
ncbi:Glucan synthase-like 1 isoform 1 [Hibiscus syriacus]|uniref:RING-type E3 ubiquitin transferase n=1 Tax=Hibiscus syriacus TaxID=106335 RepID=A0A6A3BK70_HIBSY|nr:uncharacterized protein LOC120214657 [Hibiscus syriacus]KAE8716953.1 Glucan synthase-like 1 isoform 1 [Hibiscus syriacus]